METSRRDLLKMLGLSALAVAIPEPILATFVENVPAEIEAEDVYSTFKFIADGKQYFLGDITSIMHDLPTPESYFAVGYGLNPRTYSSEKMTVEVAVKKVNYESIKKASNGVMNGPFEDDYIFMGEMYVANAGKVLKFEVTGIITNFVTTFNSGSECTTARAEITCRKSPIFSVYRA